MTSFIAYQPPANAPSFGNHIFSKPSIVGLCSRVSSDGKDTLDGLAKYNTDSPVGDKEGGDNESHEGDALYTRTLARCNGSNECSSSRSGIGPDAPASVGQIYDVFAEYEETFGMARGRQKTAVTTLRDCPHSDTTAASISRLVGRGMLQLAADDGVADVEQLAETAGGDAGCNNLSKEEIGNGSTSQPRQESDGQDPETEDVRPYCVSTLASDFRSENACAFIPHPPPPPPMATNEATQAAPNRKRTRPSTQLTVIPDDDIPQKRPRRATKETWKARETRETRKVLEEVEAKRSQTSSDRYRKTPAPFVYRDSGMGEVVSKVANIEDAYLGEDGYIQCLVTWKPSLIAMENLVGEELQRRCEELFRKRYGHQGLQRGVVSKRQTRKK